MALHHRLPRGTASNEPNSKLLAPAADHPVGVEGDVTFGGAQLVEELGTQLAGGLGVGEPAEAALQRDELPVAQALPMAAAACPLYQAGRGGQWGCRRVAG
ncbi:hypothetical protein Aau02nite_89200 [Amorphoplanes auranticolor]|uniref:Uncharacterized protein n=1 Tax=Actinoplanes auranticolor TaxID=47988 RepID=A0A919W552_9ACTN|nr:hypothetical protein Aau02nite_89200 [Actinoplanes auranticolor]